MHNPRPRVTRLRRESWGFAIGSAFFALGVIPWYADAVGGVADAATFFIGSLFFTAAGFIQLALSGRRPPKRTSSIADVWDWWAAAVQFVGTLLFNVSTGAVLLRTIQDAATASTGWVPDAWGSIAFLISSCFALVAAYRQDELWDRNARTAHGVWLNMAGSILFGFSAIGAIVLTSGQLYNIAWVNVGTFLGAVCFFLAAVLARRELNAAQLQHA
ncbi:YrhK family protein [Microbacterium candidum]|uniref:YrhK family protein n=1 Tax=Microbacterium candidum TaxID=3041922 RepID=A0ABT7N261_9MICO|nr:YrhK family protein [Microbacterium sp. ASV49]MDL9980800.1 YrhK family protein [Microbacterium sp. ASV49]